jgi:hypothetical protein
VATKVPTAWFQRVNPKRSAVRDCDSTSYLGSPTIGGGTPLSGSFLALVWRFGWLSWMYACELFGFEQMVYGFSLASCRLTERSVESDLSLSDGRMYRVCGCRYFCALLQVFPDIVQRRLRSSNGTRPSKKCIRSSRTCCSNMGNIFFSTDGSALPV